MIDLLRKNGPFYKANLHCHTTNSDGRMTAAEVKDWYQSHGYSIVGFTDHSNYLPHPELQSEDFLAIYGFEGAFICKDPKTKNKKYKCCHLNFWAADPEHCVYTPEEFTYDVGVINRYIAKMKAGGWLCGLNHPSWSLQTSEEINSIRGIDSFEVYNHHSYVLDNNGEDQANYAIYLREGNRAWCTATDDNHSDGDDTLGGYIQISMPGLTYENFVKAFRAGSFYASSGPEFKNLYIDEERDMLVMDCSPVAHVLVKGVHTVRAFRLASTQDDITHAEVPLAPIREIEPHFRVEIATKDMLRAYAQPYWFDDEL